MTLEQRTGELAITWLPVEQMGLLSLGLALGPEEKTVLEALLRGERVTLAQEGLEYKKFKKTAPLGIYQKFVAMERELREMGVIVTRDRYG
jgi:hypothetical protein